MISLAINASVLLPVSVTNPMRGNSASMLLHAARGRRPAAVPAQPLGTNGFFVRPVKAIRHYQRCGAHRADQKLFPQALGGERRPTGVMGVVRSASTRHTSAGFTAGDQQLARRPRNAISIPGSRSAESEAPALVLSGATVLGVLRTISLSRVQHLRLTETL